MYAVVLVVMKSPFRSLCPGVHLLITLLSNADNFDYDWRCATFPFCWNTDSISDIPLTLLIILLKSMPKYFNIFKMYVTLLYPISIRSYIAHFGPYVSKQMLPWNIPSHVKYWEKSGKKQKGNINHKTINMWYNGHVI